MSSLTDDLTADFSKWWLFISTATADPQDTGDVSFRNINRHLLLTLKIVVDFTTACDQGLEIANCAFGALPQKFVKRSIVDRLGLA